MSLWPWTRIRELEREVVLVMRERDRADVLLTATLEQADNAQAEVRRLTDIVVGMRRDGFNPPPPVAQQAAQEDLDPRVQAALESRAKSGSELYREMYRDALTMLQAGRDAEEVANEIYEGGAE